MTRAVAKRVDGYTETVRNETPPPDFREVVHEPQPAYLSLILLTFPADVATLPFQAIWGICQFYRHGI